MRITLYDHCMEQADAALLRQWHPTRNGALTARDVSRGSKRKVWWLCDKGHAWQAAVYTRTDGSGCPYCAGKAAFPGETDLASRYPALAAQWDFRKNGGLTPSTVLPGSHKKVWWVCERGHAWQAAVKSRVSGCGCPVCANREICDGENDLATVYPHLAAQWHPSKNGTLTPRNVVPGSRRKVWWQCGRGHIWQASVVSRANGAGCPVCAGKRILPGENDLASVFPAVAAQWHPTLNGTLRADGVSPYSNRKAWWRCERGHAYQAVIERRTAGGSGCPYCTGKKVLAGFNDLAALEPQLAAQWHPALNGALTPEMVTAGSHRQAWWQCPEGHVWKAMVYSRTGPKRCGCPVCAGKIKPEHSERYTAALAGQATAANAVFNIDDF